MSAPTSGSGTNLSVSADGGLIAVYIGRAGITIVVIIDIILIITVRSIIIMFLDFVNLFPGYFVVVLVFALSLLILDSGRGVTTAVLVLWRQALHLPSWTVYVHIPRWRESY